MVYWITGRANSGKTTLAHKIAKQINGIVLDGDEMRKYFPQSFESGGRRANLYGLTVYAKILDKQGFNVVIACVSPNKSLRKEFQKEFKDCIEIQMPFGELWEGTEYEE